MMQPPMDALSQLALCCSSGCKRRDYNKPPRNYFYSPTSALLDPNSGWPIAHNPHHYGHPHHHPHQHPPPQPYFLLTQPVIITSNSASNPTNTITLVQHAQSAPNAGNFPSLSILGTSTASAPGLQQAQQPNVVTSQYAIYQSPAALNNSIMGPAQATTIYENHQQAGLNRNQSTYILNKSPMLPIMEAAPSPSIHPQLTQQHQHQHLQQQQQPAQQQSQPQQGQRRPATLNSELFRQLEVIEKQVDLSREMELVERHGIVTNRALDPYSLMPHLTEATLKRYHEHFLFNEDSVIRFIEIIKRPGQTLGLYIRTVHFEDPRAIRGTRAGLVVTKIDSDSPIYNSQVLHVGDEILSVNLVDIQGMSLDDVVIIMSMPKRLVLALRIPRERDRLLAANLLQQQQMFRNLLEQRENSILGYPPPQQQHQFEVEQSGLVVEQGLRSANSLGGGGSLQRPNSRPAMHFNESHLEQRERQPQQSRPGAMKIGDELFGELTRTWEEEEDVVGSISNIQDFDLISGSNINVRGAMSKERISIAESSRFSRPLLYTSSIGIGGASVNTSTNNHENILNSNNNLENTVASTTPSTLPRRTLPARPTLVSSSQPGTMVKQPVISNIRLGDTPEQSSYFSSSIDAINRELKELRRQRMALSNNEQSVDSSTGVGASRDTGFLVSGATDMSWSDNWTHGAEMKLHNLVATTTATNSPPSTQPGS